MWRDFWKKTLILQGIQGLEEKSLTPRPPSRDLAAGQLFAATRVNLPLPLDTGPLVWLRENQPRPWF